MSRLIQCLSLVMSVFFFENCIFAEDPSFVEIEKDAIQARLNIKTLSGKVDISGWDIQSGAEKKEEWASQRFFWMDGDRVRVDVIPSTGPTAGIRETECLNCDKMG